MIALDASALLTYLFRERGHEQVRDVLGESCISTVNVAETLGRFTRDGKNIGEVLRWLSGGPVELVPFTTDHAAVAAALLPRTRRLGLSLGDRACLALGEVRRVPVLTADRAWLDTGLDLEVRVVR